MPRLVAGSSLAIMGIALIAASPAVGQDKQAAPDAKPKEQKLFTYFDPTAPAATPERKAEAAALATRLWTNALSACEGRAIQNVDERLMIQLDEPQFTLVSMRIPPAAKEVGYEYRGIAIATAKRWRWATRDTKSPNWSAWDVGDKVTVRDDNLTLDRGQTTLPNVVLKYDIWMKDGAWGANAPISSVSYAVRPVDLSALPDDAARPACASQMAGA